MVSPPRTDGHTVDGAGRLRGDGCEHVVVWRSSYACPQCTATHFKKMIGPCINGTRTVRYDLANASAHPCNQAGWQVGSGYKPPEERQQTCAGEVTLTKKQVSRARKQIVAERLWTGRKLLVLVAAAALLLLGMWRQHSVHSRTYADYSRLQQRLSRAEPGIGVGGGAELEEISVELEELGVEIDTATRVPVAPRHPPPAPIDPPAPAAPSNLPPTALLTSLPGAAPTGARLLTDDLHPL